MLASHQHKGRREAGPKLDKQLVVHAKASVSAWLQAPA